MYKLIFFVSKVKTFLVGHASNGFLSPLKQHIGCHGRKKRQIKFGKLKKR